MMGKHLDRISEILESKDEFKNNKITVEHVWNL